MVYANSNINETLFAIDNARVKVQQVLDIIYDETTLTTMTTQDADFYSGSLSHRRLLLNNSEYSKIGISIFLNPKSSHSFLLLFKICSQINCSVGKISRIPFTVCNGIALFLGLFIIFCFFKRGIRVKLKVIKFVKLESKIWNCHPRIFF